jgi:hypothetical protein
MEKMFLPRSLASRRTAVDGDTIRLNGRAGCLWGIDEAELHHGELPPCV